MESGIKESYKIGVISMGLLTKAERLVGVKAAYIVDTTDEAEHALRELLDNPDIGLIMLSEGSAGLIKDRRLRNLVDSSLMPLIVEVPGYKEKEGATDTLRRLIIKVVGIDIYGSVK